MAGIIPAGAGLTGISKLPMWQIRDHPRGCRAHIYDANTSARVWGSSPRVRGSLWHEEARTLLVGIIPAGAGLTSTSRKRRFATGDHPRGCGAHMAVTAIIATGLGSSPRVRGSQLLHKNALEGIGIIPAGAGLTLATVRRPTADWDHPRGCGAHRTASKASTRRQGSSPRVRGSHESVTRTVHVPGIIPAGAGLTPCFF